MVIGILTTIASGYFLFGTLFFLNYAGILLIIAFLGVCCVNLPRCCAFIYLIVKEKNAVSRHIQVNVWIITLIIEVCLALVNYLFLFFFMFSNKYLQYTFGYLMITIITTGLSLATNAYFTAIMGSYSNFGNIAAGPHAMPGSDVPQNPNGAEDD